MYRITFSNTTTTHQDMDKFGNMTDVTITRNHVVKTNDPQREIEYYTGVVGLQVLKIETRNDKGEWE